MSAPEPAAFADLTALQNVRAGSTALLGIPWDRMSTHLRGCAEAPSKIRAALYGGSSNLAAEDGTDLAAPETGFVDVGDLVLAAPDEAPGVVRAIQHAVGVLLERGARVVSLGGDHAVTLPVVRAYAERLGPLEILHFDAHPDLYDHYEGNRFSHACPFARIMEEGLARRLVQVGIRTMNAHQREQAERFGVEVIGMASLERAAGLQFSGPVYVSVDLDGLDPAFAPGVSHHEPGGLSTRDLLRIVQAVRAPVVRADVVELNPRRDVHDMTAMVGAKLVKELASAIGRSGDAPMRTP
ncbi:MAG: agmatinase [Planctomycetota bacterium]